MMRDSQMALGRMGCKHLVKCAALFGPYFLWSVLFCALGANAWANDGFYQGAGSTLTLKNNSYLRVRKEHLLIAPISPPVCYSVRANGKAIEDGKDIDPHAKINLGGQVKCDDGDVSTLKVKWRAKAEYEVEVMKSQANVRIGFPVETWERYFDDSSGLNSVYAPGVANFHTYINDAEIANLELKILKHAPLQDVAQKDEVGFVWRASFRAGEPYKLRTEYEFGVDNSNAFYAGREYVAGETPWFLGVMPEPFTADRIIYFLTPLRSWAAPPPEQIEIEVRLSDFPVAYFVPLALKPACVSTKALYYLLKNQFPTDELSISMPTEWWTRDKLKPLTTLVQWNKWQKTLGGSAKVGCDVIEELKRTASPDLESHISKYQCVPSCSDILMK